jgi:hypothetical protein
VTGVAYYDAPSVGSRHGVYVPGERSASASGRRLSTVRAFLQKPSPSEAKASGALRGGKVAVDTGILWIEPPTAAKMAESGWKVGDLYVEFARELVDGFAPFSVNVVPKCSFFHVGSTRELLERLGGGREWVEACALARGEMKLGGRNVVTFVPAEYGPVELGEGECLTCLPVGGKWIPVRYRVRTTSRRTGSGRRSGFRG